MPIGINVVAPAWRTWGWCFEEDKHDDPEAKKFLEVTKQIEFSAPPDFKYPTVKYRFKWDKPIGLHQMKEHNGQNLVSVEDFFDHALIDAMMGDTIDQIMYYDKLGGKEIMEQEAFTSSKVIDPTKKPASKRPGKRPAPAPTPPATPSKKASP